MAARKKGPQEPGSLFGATPAPKVMAPAPAPAPEPLPPHDTPVIAERKLRLVPDAPEEDVTIEPAEGGGFWVSVVRGSGAACATVLYTRKQLEMLMRRIPAALEMGVEE